MDHALACSDKIPETAPNLLKVTQTRKNPQDAGKTASGGFKSA
jgi:hypothetical protein